MRGRTPRGQGMVELALSLLVFVTVLLFGIHFAEVGYLSLKVQEAGAHAVWEATRYRVQDHQAHNAALMAAIPNAVQLEARGRYRDFNSVSTGDTGGARTKALTRVENFGVTCRENRNGNLLFPGPAGTGWFNGARLSGVFDDRGDLRCSAEADFVAIRIPRAFLDDSKGFFKAAHRVNRPMKICAAGRATGGNCQGEYSAMLNDWAFSGEVNNISDDCKLSGCANWIYKDTVRQMFGGGGGGAGAALAGGIAGGAPTSAGEFHFSFSGEESGYTQGVGDENGVGPYNTGSPGIGMLPAASVGRCFLGRAPMTSPAGPGC